MQPTHEGPSFTPSRRAPAASKTAWRQLSLRRSSGIRHSSRPAIPYGLVDDGGDAAPRNPCTSISSATRPPSDMPTAETPSRRSARMKSAIASAMPPKVRASGVTGDAPWPGRSTATTSFVLASSSATPSQEAMLPPKPCSSRTGSPAPCRVKLRAAAACVSRRSMPQTKRGVKRFDHFARCKRHKCAAATALEARTRGAGGEADCFVTS